MTCLLTLAGRLTQEKHGFKARALIPLLANARSIVVLVVFDKRVRRFVDDGVPAACLCRPSLFGSGESALVDRGGDRTRTCGFPLADSTHSSFERPFVDND